MWSGVELRLHLADYFSSEAVELLGWKFMIVFGRAPCSFLHGCFLWLGAVFHSLVVVVLFSPSHSLSFRGWPSACCPGPPPRLFWAVGCQGSPLFPLAFSTARLVGQRASARCGHRKSFGLEWLGVVSGGAPCGFSGVSAYFVFFLLPFFSALPSSFFGLGPRGVSCRHRYLYVSLMTHWLEVVLSRLDACMNGIRLIGSPRDFRLFVSIWFAFSATYAFWGRS